MANKNHPPRRRSPVHQPIIWSDHSSVVLFVTVNTKLKKPLLARCDIHDVLLESWALADDWLVGRYAIMPEHLHFFCSPRDSDAPLRRWMGYWRRLASRRWPRPEEKPVWQRGYWDTQLRQQDGRSPGKMRRVHACLLPGPLFHTGRPPSPRRRRNLP